jgi:hypothetical protein
MISNDLDLFDLYSDSEEEEDELSQSIVERRLPPLNPLDKYSDEEFRMRFRMSKLSCSNLCNLIEMKVYRRIYKWNTLSPIIQLMMCLRVLGSGVFQIIDGDLFNVTQPTVSRVVRDVTTALASLAPSCIRMPTREESIRVKNGFRKIAGMKDIIGAIDGTHIRIRVAGIQNKERFMNRKNQNSINVQAVVDDLMRFTNLVVRWPGSTHDARILRESDLRAQFENGIIDYGILLGDAGYPCKEYLLTPISRCNENDLTQAEKKYNKAHKKTRCLVERTFDFIYWM